MPESFNLKVLAYRAVLEEGPVYQVGLLSKVKTLMAPYEVDVCKANTGIGHCWSSASARSMLRVISLDAHSRGTVKIDRAGKAASCASTRG